MNALLACVVVGLQITRTHVHWFGTSLMLYYVQYLLDRCTELTHIIVEIILARILLYIISHLRILFDGASFVYDWLCAEGALSLKPIVYCIVPFVKGIHQPTQLWRFNSRLNDSTTIPLRTILYSCRLHTTYRVWSRSTCASHCDIEGDCGNCAGATLVKVRPCSPLVAENC